MGGVFLCVSVRMLDKAIGGYVVDWVWWKTSEAHY